MQLIKLGKKRFTRLAESYPRDPKAQGWQYQLVEITNPTLGSGKREPGIELQLTAAKGGKYVVLLTDTDILQINATRQRLRGVFNMARSAPR